MTDVIKSVRRQPDHQDQNEEERQVETQKTKNGEAVKPQCDEPSDKRSKGLLLTSGVLVFFSLFAWRSSALGFVDRGVPDSGFFPMIASVIGILCCLAILLRLLFVTEVARVPQLEAISVDSEVLGESTAGGPNEGTLNGAEGASAPAGKVRAALQSFYGVSAVLLAGLALVPVVGLPVALGLVILYLSRVVLEASWTQALIVAVATPACAYVLFGLVLSVQFPASLLGI